MNTIAKIVTFPFLFLAYYSLIVSIGLIVSSFVNLILSMLSRRFRRAVAEKIHIATIVEGGVIVLTIPLMLLFYWYYGWIDNQAAYIWDNTLLVGLMILGLLLKIPHMSTTNPFLRRTTGLVWIIPVSLVVVLPVGRFSENVFDASMVKWSTLAAFVLVTFEGAFAFIRTVPQLQRFQLIDQKIKEVGHRIDRLQRLIPFLSGNRAGDELDRILNVARQWHAAASQSAETNKLKDAENGVVVAEIELSEISRRINDEQASWLQQVSAERFASLKAEVGELTDVYKERHLQTDRLVALGDEIAQMLQMTSQAEAHDAADRYQELGHEIGELRAALRFQDNVVAELDGLEAELTSHSSIADLGNVLKLDTSRLQRTVTGALEPLQKVRARKYGSMDELVRMVQDLRDKAAQASEARRELLAKVAARWHRREYADGAIAVYCPKYCKTNEAVRGAIQLQWVKIEQNKVSVAIS